MRHAVEVHSSDIRMGPEGIEMNGGEMDRIAILEQRLDALEGETVWRWAVRIMRNSWRAVKCLW